MIWHSWGHSHLAAAPGEFSFSAPDEDTQYETGRFMDWFDHYLKDENTETGPEFAYFRNWIDYGRKRGTGLRDVRHRRCRDRSRLPSVR